jgi:hypothetical protein
MTIQAYLHRQVLASVSLVCGKTRISGCCAPSQTTLTRLADVSRDVGVEDH